MKMNRFRENALRKEFPFLGELLDDVKPEEISIKRIDINLLNLIPEHNGWSGSAVGINSGERILFVLSDGSVIKNAVAQSGRVGSNYAYTETREWDGETILHAIDRHGVSATLEYIVAHRYGVRTIEHYSEGQSLAIYKPGKGIDLPGLIRAAYTAAAEQVAAESDL